ncbi:ser/Thr protein phosphatase-like protein family [Pleomassaria siparia CBS 279.74]|uniref:Ser/Thr protein phosphatase-like protein family n=1 Tax=Pleomassaria siparia CBS 279.74 TaxID=1314801 RepID=A0A6G1KP63_9PLEO|nr:ser/Thr protein phosphatase-like protein family [Pleomassaria siparia CBS 279.74]
MSYRAGTYDDSHRPLIDLIPNDSLYVSDEEDGFYDGEDNYLINPKWKASVQRVCNHIPRRLQRYLAIYIGLLVAAWLVWQTFFSASYNEHQQQIALMDSTTKETFGSNLRPHFKHMIQVGTMDKKHLPVEDKRLIVIGDVHGCKEELQALLEKVGFDADNDHVILTGDMINKGPDSPGVVSFVEKIGASSVRGNHEDRILLTITDMENSHVALPGPQENANRTNDTLEEESFSQGDYKIRKLAKKFSKKQIAWLRERPVILRVGHVHGMGDVVVVHAGLVPDIPLEQQDPYQVMNMRTIDLKTRVPSENRDGTPWEKFWNHRQKKLPSHKRMTVIYGHDRKRGKNIQKYSKGLDSGCVGGGHLTALVIDSKGKNKYVQVKCKQYID